MDFGGMGRAPGTGVGGDVVVNVVEREVEGWTACSFFSERVEYMAAVTPAPVAALTAAMIAIVVFDILADGMGVYCIYLLHSGVVE